MLYKYVGSTTPEETINYLEYFLNNGTIRASNPSTFNDPSELKMDLNINVEKEVARKVYIDAGADVGGFENWFSGLESSKWSVIDGTRRTLMDMYGVVCLTPKPDNYLMWSHYASSHKGFCIGFDDAFIQTIQDVGISGSVDYSDNVPVFNFFTETHEVFASKMFFNKHTCWAYEEEYRVITFGSGPKEFHKGLIREIILGCAVPFEVEKYVRQYLGKGIEISKMVTPYNTYLLEKRTLEENTYF